MSDFNVFATITTDIRQIYYLNGQIYASNYTGSTGVPGPVYSVNTTTAVSTTITSLAPSSLAIAVVAGNIYTPTYLPVIDQGNINQIDISTGVVTTFNFSSTYLIECLIHNSTNTFIGSNQNTQIVTITLASGTATYSPLFTSPTGPVTSITLGSYNTLYAMIPANKLIYVIDKTNPSSYNTINLSTLSIDFSSSNFIIQNGICFDSTNNFLYFAVANSTTSTTTMYRLITSTDTLDTFSLVCVPGVAVRSITMDESGYLYYNQLNGNIYRNNIALCFNKGTKILCMNHQLEDEYIPIEKLRIGDFVKTFKHGYRKISKVIQGKFMNNPKKWNMCMYKMAKTDSNGLLEDLIVTGGHSILVDSLSDAVLLKYEEMGIPDFANQTIDKKHLVLSCVSDEFVPMQNHNRYHYYHLLLENNDDEEERFGIWANGVLTETPNVKTVK